MINKKVGAIYYTDNCLNILIMKVCQEQLRKSFDGEIISVSLKPIDFGRNIVLNEERGYITMIRQIVTALENSTANYVFYVEHDCLYNFSHFSFIPIKDNIFYYNSSVLRWQYGSETAITYDRMLPLSCLCVNREFALEHYRMRLKMIEENLDKFNSREPELARKWGYEPGTKKKKRGGITDDDFETWQSKYPVIDIRHKGTFSPPKCTLNSFKHLPVNWRETKIEDIEGWDLKKLFTL